MLRRDWVPSRAMESSVVFLDLRSCDSREEVGGSGFGSTAQRWQRSYV